jgi:hypothetical protein
MSIATDKFGWCIIDEPETDYNDAPVTHWMPLPELPK